MFQIWRLEITSFSLGVSLSFLLKWQEIPLFSFCRDLNYHDGYYEMQEVYLWGLEKVRLWCLLESGGLAATGALRHPLVDLGSRCMRSGQEPIAVAVTVSVLGWSQQLPCAGQCALRSKLHPKPWWFEEGSSRSVISQRHCLKGVRWCIWGWHLGLSSASCVLVLAPTHTHYKKLFGRTLIWYRRALYSMNPQKWWRVLWGRRMGKAV